MAARLTDKQKKKIVADYMETNSYNAAAKMNGVSWETAKRVVSETEGIEKILEQKKEENTADVLAYMESKKTIVCEIIEKGLMALNDPEKLKGATPNQITTAIGTLIDKWIMVNGSSGTDAKEDGLSASLRELAKELESD